MITKRPAARQDACESESELILALSITHTTTRLLVDKRAVRMYSYTQDDYAHQHTILTGVVRPSRDAGTVLSPCESPEILAAYRHHRQRAGVQNEAGDFHLFAPVPDGNEASCFWVGRFSRSRVHQLMLLASGRCCAIRSDAGSLCVKSQTRERGSLP